MAYVPVLLVATVSTCSMRICSASHPLFLLLGCLWQELLKACGRSHTLSDVHAAINTVKTCNFPSWSLDLISGLPGLTLSGWRRSLEQAVAAGPDHISVYDLQV